MSEQEIQKILAKNQSRRDRVTQLALAAGLEDCKVFTYLGHLNKNYHSIRQYKPETKELRIVHLSIDPKKDDIMAAVETLKAAPWVKR